MNATATASRRDEPLDPVQRARHYNSHPSQVEAIDLVEEMPFNLGNAWKYLHRADEKGATLQDLNKALWYVRREARRHRIAARSRRLPRETLVRPAVGALARKFLKFESGLRREVFSALWLAYTTGHREGSAGPASHLSQAERLLCELIRAMEASK